MTPRQKLLEKYVSFKHRMRRKVAAKRTAAIRKAGAFTTPHRRNQRGMVKKLNTMARQTMMKRMFPGIADKVKDMNPYQQAAIQAFIDKRRDNIRSISKKHRSRGSGKRADLKRISRAHYNRYSVDKTGGFGSTTT